MAQDPDLWTLIPRPSKQLQRCPRTRASACLSQHARATCSARQHRLACVRTWARCQLRPAHAGSSGAACAAGRDENLVEYDVGFEADGNITALDIRGYFLTGAELDLGDNDPQVMAAGMDQVPLLPSS